MKFSLNSNQLIVSIKNAVPINKKEDDFNLRWYDNIEPSEGHFRLDLTNSITPPDILSQLKENQIELAQTWLILDEFVFF
jgi:hypothetical protein